MTTPEIRFYSDSAQKNLNHEIFSSVAEQWASAICRAGLKEKLERGKPVKKLEKNKISQIRKFYDEALRIASCQRDGEVYDNILPFIKMLNAKAAYAMGRNLITAEFSEFLKKSIGQIDANNPQSLELFLNFFEAFMGYYKFEETKYKGNDNE